VIITERTDWISQEEWEQTRDDLLAQLNRWKNDWETRDPDRFLLHYSSNMTSGKGAGWARDKRRNILDKEWIRINLSNISLFLYGNGNMAYAEFTQSYSSNTLSSVSSKRLYWQMQQGAWRVALEKAQDIPISNKLAQR
jgi:hypothetical protein